MVSEQGKIIKVKNLSYKHILEDVNITFLEGVNYIRGGNGTGKSILLDCLSGINRRFQGEITGNSHIIYLNQNLYFSPRLTCKDFVQFVFLLDNIRDYKKVFWQKVNLLQQSSLFEKIWKTPVGMLSGGEREKLFFLVLTCLDREWYLFDEPFSGVDSEGKDTMIAVIKKLKDEKKGIIITSHEEEPLSKIKEVNFINL